MSKLPVCYWELPDSTSNTRKNNEQNQYSAAVFRNRRNIDMPSVATGVPTVADAT